MQAQNENARIGALNIMLKANEKLAETVVIPSLIQDIAEIKKTIGPDKKW